MEFSTIDNIIREVSARLDIQEKKVKAVVSLLDEGATVPFISRYRKEATGGMDEVAVRAIAARHKQLSEIEKRKEYIIGVISEKEKLTPELAERIENCFDTTELEDIFLPYRPRRATRAQAARELGLEPLAKIIMSQQSDNISRQAAKFAKQGAGSAEAAIAGAKDIIAEWVSESEKARAMVRAKFQRSAVIRSRVVKGKEAEGANYATYFDVSEPLRLCNSHRYLAMRRGEEEGFLKVDISIDDEEMTDTCNACLSNRAPLPSRPKSSAAPSKTATCDCCAAQSKTKLPPR